MAWLVSEGRVLASAELAADRRARSKGLLGRESLEGALVLRPCRWVHTLGMRFALDVAYLDTEGVVVKTVHMRRNRVGVPVLGARWVIEASGGAFARWGLRVGDMVEVRGDGPSDETFEPGAGRSILDDGDERRRHHGDVQRRAERPRDRSYALSAS